jgi:hypothetical protein
VASLVLVFFAGRLVLQGLEVVPTMAEVKEDGLARVNAEMNLRQSEIAVLQFAVDPSCKSCESIFPFYRALIATRSGRDFRINAMLGVSAELDLGYLEHHDLVVDEIRRVDVASKEFAATPTVLMLDARGNMLRKWHGQLSIAEQNEIVFLLGVQEPFIAADRRILQRKAWQNGASPVTANVKDAASAIKSGLAVVVDTSARSQFAAAHLQGSINIPLDELEIRAPVELGTGTQVLVFCHSAHTCAVDELISSNSSSCSSAVSFLRKAGFNNAQLLSASLSDLRSQGVAVQSSERIYLPRILLSENFD